MIEIQAILKHIVFNVIGDLNKRPVPALLTHPLISLPSQWIKFTWQRVGFMNSVEELGEEVEMVRGFCYLGERVNTGGGCEAARARIGWVKFREYGELLNSLLTDAERNGLSELCKIGDVIWE